MRKSDKKYRILLYYKYVRIDDAELYAKRHLKFCKALGLMGRILIADEGINGTISGTPEQCDAYIQALHMDPRFTDMEFKIDESNEHAFRKIFVRYRSEIVTLNLEDDIDPNEITGNHLSPKEFMETLEKEDVLIIDARNDYEFDLGHLKMPFVRMFLPSESFLNGSKRILRSTKTRRSLHIVQAVSVARSSLECS